MSSRSVPAHPTGRARLGRAADTRLSGRWLILTRLVWIVLVVYILGYFIASLPEIFVTLHQACTGAWCTNATGRLTASQIHSLLQVGISLDAYAWSWLVITGVTALVWFGVGGILFWRKYAGLIIGLQFLLGGIIKPNNDVAIVASTLTIAALFQPLRHRIQQVIDQRFYRRKYDAARTLAAFSTALRNEVDLATLNEHLVAIVQETMQPVSVSLWLWTPAHRGNHQVLRGATPSLPSEGEARDER